MIKTSRRYLSPLRYPGGKASMASFLADTYAGQYGLMDIEIWLEPFAGGAGAALAMLDTDTVEEAWLVDFNPAIASFWQNVTSDNEAFARLVEQTTPTRDLYEASRDLIADPAGADRFELGYAAFIVNRCSRSGIVSHTSGAMPDVTARFNSAALADRIRHIGTFRSRLKTMEGDGISYIEDLDFSGIADEVFVFADPPYIREGGRLYSKSFDGDLHQRLADALNETGARWLLTYDDAPEVLDLYPDRRILSYAIRNTANRARVAHEYAIVADNVWIPNVTGLTNHGPAEWVQRVAAA